MTKDYVMMICGHRKHVVSLKIAGLQQWCEHCLMDRKIERFYVVHV